MHILPQLKNLEKNFLMKKDLKTVSLLKSFVGVAYKDKPESQFLFRSESFKVSIPCIFLTNTPDLGSSTLAPVKSHQKAN